jgi:hypothetical protein
MEHRVAMLRRLVPLAIFAAFASVVGGCNAVKPGRSPGDTFDAAKRAILEESYEGLWRLISRRARDAESASIRTQQREVEASLGDMTPSKKVEFFEQNAVRPEVFVNMSPAEAFAANMRNTARVASGLREALLDSSVATVVVDGDTATLTVEIPGETAAKLVFEREDGLWMIPSMSEFFSALRLAGRLRSAGKSPKDTYDALLACVAGGDYESVWGLFADDLQARLAQTFQLAIDGVKSLDDDRKREFGRQAGVSAEEYVTLGPKEMLAVSLRNRFKEPAELSAILSRRVVHTVVEGDIATMSLAGAEGNSTVRLKKIGDKWYLMDF